jgi:hypothetical protein
MNLLMLAQLRDVSGKIRYTLGAQIDVSSVVPDSTDLNSAASRRAPQIGFMGTNNASEDVNRNDEFEDSNEMLDLESRDDKQSRRAPTIKDNLDDDVRSINGDWRRPALLRGLSSASLSDRGSDGWVNSRLSGFYQHVSPPAPPDRLWLITAVSPHPPIPILTCSLCFAIFANTWDSAIPHHR